MTIYGHFKSRQDLIEVVVRRVLAAANDALGEVDLTGDAAGALSRLVDATSEVTARSGSLLVAAEKALPATMGPRGAFGRPAKRGCTTSSPALSRAGESVTISRPTGWSRRSTPSLHAAANEIAAGRLDGDRAAGVITATMLGAGATPAAAA